MKKRQMLVLGGAALGVGVVALIGVLVSQRPQILLEEKGMREIRHNTLSYRGRANEAVSVRVEAQGDTNHLVHYVLDGALPARVLPAGQKITFNLKNNSGAQTILQVDLDFTAEGSYKVVVENVVDCSRDTASINECVRTVEGFADGQTLNFQFFVE